MKFEGIYTPAITPLTNDGKIDNQAFSEVLESLIEAKVHGIIIGGSTGEYYAHTPEERFALSKLAKDVIGDRTALIIGTGATRTEDSIEYAKVAKEIKADAILVGSPPYALPTEAEKLYNYFLEKTKSIGTITESGIFGADMQVSLVNDGPVTFLLET